MENKEEIIMGSGELYMQEFDGTEIPAHEAIETDEFNVGHCNSGFSIEYTPELYDVKNQYGKIVKRFTISETIAVKTGIISWALNKLALLSTAQFEIDKTKKTRKLVFGGRKSLKNVLVRFVHEKDNGKKIRFTAIAQGGNGFALEFTGDKELTIDAQLSAIERKKDWLAEFEEELTDEEFAALNPAQLAQEGI